MIMLNEVAKSGPFMVVYKDSDDPYLFYYMPRFASIAKADNGRFIFGEMFFQKPHSEDSYSVYNMSVRGVFPGPEFQAVKDELERNLGHSVSIVPVPGFDITADPITDLSFVLYSQKIQAHGGNLFTDLAISMTFLGWCEPAMSNLFKTDDGWTGAVNYKITGETTPFKATITANWHRIQDHFRAETSVHYWFVSANLSYETQKLIDDGTLTVDITGGTPEQKDKIYSMAKEIAARLFVESIQPNPLPNHPDGSIVCLSVNYSRVEEDKVTSYHFEEHDIETRQLGMAIVVGGIPDDYFHGIGRNKALDYSLNEPFELQAERAYAKRLSTLLTSKK